MNIIHQDLKTDNIFITDGRGGNFIKIGDLGMGILFEDRDDDSKRNADTNDYESFGSIAMDLFCINKKKYGYVM